jgi:RNA polymerase sigma-70 factor (ECF subfamily)
MNDQELGQHLSQMTTEWTAVLRAHGGSPDGATLARQVLVERYSGAISRYLLASLRDPEGASELAQEFALRFMKGDFQAVHPERGRFRDYLKTVLINLIRQYRKQSKACTVSLPPGDIGPLAPAGDDLEQQFLSHWREELLARAWQELAELEQTTGQPYHTVLRFRAEHPGASSDEMADQLGAYLGKRFTSAAIRQALHRAREKFAAFLLDEVSRSLENSSRDELDRELVDLGLLQYCRSALARRTC